MSNQADNQKNLQTQKASRFTVDIESMLVEGEQVIEQGRIHAGIYWQSIAVLVIAFLMLFLVHEFAILLAIVGLIMFAYATLKKEILLFVLTDKRIFVRYGILQVDVVDIRHNKIESIELERMLPGFLLGYATVIVAGTGNRFIAIPYVGNALAIRRSYNRLTLEDDEVSED